MSGDGRLIVFQSQSDLAGQKIPAKTTEIWMYDVTARRFTRITTSPEPGRQSMNPAISADGSTVVFDSDADLLNEGVPVGQQEIWSYSVAAGRTRRLTRGGARAISARPATNADGSIVAFYSNVAFDGDGTAGKSRDIWLLTPASSTPIRVTRSEPGRRVDRPALDAAGHTLVFESDAVLAGHQVPPGQIEIWMYDVRGQSLKRITDAADPSRVSQAPSISADGRKVVFQSQADLGRTGHPDSVDEIWLYDTTKDALEKLTTTWVAARDAGTQAARHPDCQNARITADGRRVIFASDMDFLGEKKVVNGYPHVWILDLTTRRLERIDTAAGSGSGVAISADASKMALFRSAFDDFRLSNVSTASGPPRPDKLSAEEARTDLDAFEKELTGRWAYLKANKVDLRAAVSRLREKTVRGIDINEYGLELQKIISMFIDGHSGVSGYARTPSGSLPFFIEHTNGRFLAIKPDRTAFYNPELPYVARIDGRSVEDWLKVAGPLYPQGSPQYRQYRALAMLRTLAFLRREAGAPASATARVEFVSEDRAARRDVDVPIGPAAGVAGSTWPGTRTGVIDGNVGYLRITSMGPREADDVIAWMPKFRETRGLIVDVRGNGGGLRDPLRALFPYLMSESDAPRVVNAAKYRLHADYGDDHLGGSRFMYVETSPEWTPAERAAIAAFKKTFKPEWTPPAAEFSDWHYLVMSRKTNPQAFVYGRPVIVLLDEKCFSATDIFLSALKGWHDVTLMGYASGGGSARQVGVSLPISRMSFTLASMASFQWTGQLYDTRGIHPDVVVHPGPGYFLTGGKDNILEEALRRLK
jgi:Tol biopolymer transport system component